LNGTWESTPPIGASDGGVLRLAPLGVPVVPLVRMIFAAAGDQIGQRFVGAARGLVLIRVCGQGAQLAQRRLGLGDRGGVLVVVDDQLGALPFGHLPDLRAGELAVEQDDARAHAGGAVHGDEEPAMVAREDRHPVTALDPQGQQAVGDRVRGVVEFLERQLAVVVDDRGAIGRAPGVERGKHPELTPAPDVGDHRGNVLRRLEFERAGFEHLAGVVQFG
jgi:hypothetical protein